MYPIFKQTGVHISPDTATSMPENLFLGRCGYCGGLLRDQAVPVHPWMNGRIIDILLQLVVIIQFIADRRHYGLNRRYRISIRGSDFSRGVAKRLGEPPLARSLPSKDCPGNLCAFSCMSIFWTPTRGSAASLQAPTPRRRSPPWGCIPGSGHVEEFQPYTRETEGDG